MVTVVTIAGNMSVRTLFDIISSRSDMPSWVKAMRNSSAFATPEAAALFGKPIDAPNSQGQAVRDLITLLGKAIPSSQALAHIPAGLRSAFRPADEDLCRSTFREIILSEHVSPADIGVLASVVSLFWNNTSFNANLGRECANVLTMEPYVFVVRKLLNCSGDTVATHFILPLSRQIEKWTDEETTLEAVIKAAISLFTDTEIAARFAANETSTAAMPASGSPVVIGAVAAEPAPAAQAVLLDETRQVIIAAVEAAVTRSMGRQGWSARGGDGQNSQANSAAPAPRTFNCHNCGGVGHKRLECPSTQKIRVKSPQSKQYTVVLGAQHGEPAAHWSLVERMLVTAPSSSKSLAARQSVLLDTGAPRSVISEELAKAVGRPGAPIHRRGAIHRRRRCGDRDRRHCGEDHAVA
jgi:hypothetical protein